MCNLSFISEEEFSKHVKETIQQYDKKLESFNLKRFNKNISMSEINSLISVWNYVEEHYINYMRKYQPEIDIGR